MNIWMLQQLKACLIPTIQEPAHLDIDRYTVINIASYCSNEFGSQKDGDGKGAVADMARNVQAAVCSSADSMRPKHQYS